MRRLRPWREWTLRSRMVVSIAALAAVGLIIVSVSSVLLAPNDGIAFIWNVRSDTTKFCASAVRFGICDGSYCV